MGRDIDWGASGQGAEGSELEKTLRWRASWPLLPARYCGEQMREDEMGESCSLHMTKMTTAYKSDRKTQREGLA